MKSRIAYTKPSITELETGYAADAAANGWGDKCYDYIYKFEDLFKAHLGVKHAIATSSCTGAIHMGLAALEIGEGDEVILADTNWIATVSPVKHLGATPVFIDIDPVTWCLDPDLVEKAITPNTKAIIAVHIYGNLCAMDRLLAIGEKYNIPVIEDAAEAIGSVYDGKKAGSLGLFGTFSFHGTKTITTGEGGMFVTNDSALYEKVLTLSNHGRSRQQTKEFWPDMVGFKYKISNIQAALGCGQMERIDSLIQRKRDIFKVYKQFLAQYPKLTMNAEQANTINGVWMPTVVCDPSLQISRENLQQAFKQENIDARVFFWPLSGLEFFPSKPKNLHAYDIPTRAINLPSFHDISTEEMNRVCAVFPKLLENKG